MPSATKQLPKGMALRAIAHTGAILVYEVPRDVNTRAEIETKYSPVAVKYDARGWRRDFATTQKPEYSKRRLDNVKLVDRRGRTESETAWVIFSVPQKTWRNLVPALVRDEVTKIAGKPRPGDDDAEVATIEWAPIESESIAAGRMRELFGRAGVRVSERFAEED
jgi:hypothetical protein